METTARKVKITSPNTPTEISGYDKDSYTDPLKYPYLKIVSIKIKGIDVSDVFFDLIILDSNIASVPLKPLQKIRFYMADYGSKFVEQLGYLVLYTNEIEKFKIPIPPQAFKIVLIMTSFDKIIDDNGIEVVVSTYYSAE